MQAIGVVFTASFLGLSGLAGLIVNYWRTAQHEP
jgi:hypothetical protein